jgi:ATP-dependent RNA helicase DeaD
MTELAELFADIAPDIQQSIRDLGWHTPTPVQSAAIPRMRAGGDLIVQAQTGSGKTGAFGIPLVEAVETDLAETQAIVLLPTRELANQVAMELEQLGRHRGVRVLPIYGGVAYGPQLEGLEKGAHIVVGTPGRILDHLKSKRMHLDHTKVLVLDEADEMLSLGFWPDMKEIASYLPRKRQSHLFSATMPEKVRSLSRFFLKDPEDVTIDRDETAPGQIEHYYYVCAASEKENLLARILEYEDPDSAIIFCNTKADVRFITSFLGKRGFNIDQISGDLPQAAREKAMNKIKAGKLRFLVATDVAARGIDISDLAYVINYTTSDSPEVYVHRTGRTGRAGKSGVAISLVSGLDIGNFKHMQLVVGIAMTERKAPTDRDIERRKQQREKQKEQGRLEAEWKTIRARADAENLEHAEAEMTARVERLLPHVQEAAGSDEGLRILAGVCAAYLTTSERALAEPPPLDSDGGPDGDFDRRSETDGADEVKDAGVQGREQGQARDQTTSDESTSDGPAAPAARSRRRRRSSGRDGSAARGRDDSRGDSRGDSRSDRSSRGSSRRDAR